MLALFLKTIDLRNVTRLSAVVQDSHRISANYFGENRLDSKFQNVSIILHS